jgi:Asp-tRNA(Asn)/Glu-tRNA(Gln) amidotransferase A subunit family amidase
MKRYSFIIPLFALIILLASCQKKQKDEKTLNKETIAHAEKVAGLNLDKAERDSLLDNVRNYNTGYEENREVEIKNSVTPAFQFNPVPGWMDIQKNQEKITWNLPENIKMPEDKSELAFYSVPELASLIRSQKLTSEELTRIYLNRLKKYGDTLNCVISLTKELAISQAKKADQEIISGNYRGPLHGIPYGLKDLLKVEGYKTTWGAEPYKEQKLEGNATVYKKLNQAGAVLVAKLSMGALAWGDVWYGGTTKNPWDLGQGSSGSSAGSASATAAGLVGFSIGTETYGSIVSPSTRCGVSGLRPTFGRVSRAGAMALSWTMDKIGPLCRSSKGCAMVFDQIKGSDDIDLTVKDYPFNFDASENVKNFKVGYLKGLFDEDYRAHKNDSITLKKLKEIGVSLEPVSLPDNLPVSSLNFILDAEAATAFDRLTRTGKDDKLTRQVKNAWPNVFRSARFIPAVEYIKANRIRRMWIDEFNKWVREYDAIVAPSFGGHQLLLTNLTGHPCVVVPNGFDDKGHPTSISFLGNLYDEGTLLEIANAYQKESPHEDKHPEFFK